MPKIKSFTDLLKVLAGLFITSLAISSFISIPGRKGVVATIVPSLADTFYNIFGNALLIISYVIYIGLLLLIPLAIWSYIHNRRKRSTVSKNIDKIDNSKDKTIIAIANVITAVSDLLIDVMGKRKKE